MKKKRGKNSNYYLTKLDSWWRDEIRSVGHCEYCGQTGIARASDGKLFTGLQAHHLILKDRDGWASKFRHDLSNGVCLCEHHHSKRVCDFSPHGRRDAQRAFWDWMMEKRSGQFEWYMLNKDNKLVRELSYRDLWEQLQ